MNHIILIECADDKGLIAKITSVLFKNDLNILGNWEFVDRINRLFFMRTEVEGSVIKEKILAELHQLLPAGARVRSRPRNAKKLLSWQPKRPTVWGICWFGAGMGELTLTYRP